MLSELELDRAKKAIHKLAKAKGIDEKIMRLENGESD